MKDLCFEDICQVDDTVIEQIPVPEWGGNVYLKSMKTKELNLFEDEVTYIDDNGDKQVKLEGYREKLLARTLCKADGKLMMTESQIGLLSERNAGVCNRLFQRAQQMNGLSKVEQEKMRKN